MQRKIIGRGDRKGDGGKRMAVDNDFRLIVQYVFGRHLPVGEHKRETRRRAQ